MPRRNYIAREKQTAEAVTLALSGVGQVAIAQHLGVSQSTVNADLKRARQQWADAMLGDLAAVKADELTRLELVQAEAFRAWQRTKATDANPKFLDVIVKASLRKAKLLGLDTDSKHHTQPLSDENTLEIRLSKYSAVLSLPILGIPLIPEGFPQGGETRSASGIALGDLQVLPHDG